MFIFCINYLFYLFYISFFSLFFIFFFFFNDTATTEIYTLSLHDALPISAYPHSASAPRARLNRGRCCGARVARTARAWRAVPIVSVRLMASSSFLRQGGIHRGG